MSDPSYKQQVGARLKQVAERFGGVSAMAEKLAIPQPRLSQYTSGYRLPGNKMRGRLREVLGEDVEFYIMYGGREEIDEKFKRNIFRYLMEWHPEKAAMLDLCAAHGIETAAQLGQILKAFEGMKSLLTNEPKENYSKTKKK